VKKRFIPLPPQRRKGKLKKAKKSSYDYDRAREALDLPGNANHLQVYSAAKALNEIIVDLSICMPFRYLAGKSHKFKQYGWGAADMGRVLDTLYDNMQTLHHETTLILDQSFMMDIVKQYRQELSPFRK